MHNKTQQHPQALIITADVLASIQATIGRQPAETGGILGGNRHTGQVTHFFFDRGNSHQTGIAYSPNNPLLNHILKTHWQPEGIAYLGSVHSHPPHCLHPSPGDGEYARTIIAALDLPYLLTPIVMTVPDTGSFALMPFVAVREGDGVAFIKQELMIGGQEQGYQPLSERPAWEALAAISVAGVIIAGIVIGERRQTHKRKEKKDRRSTS